MRNLKRALSLALASVMLLGMMVVGTSAASSDFTDAADIKNVAAVDVTTELGIFAGKGGNNFGAKDALTRAEMATIIVKMIEGSDFNADPYKAITLFDDIPASMDWAKGYINYAANKGIVAGKGGTKFDPTAPVTTAEAVTFIINALKVDAGEGTWPNTVMTKAVDMKLFGDLVLATNEPMTRDDLAVLLVEGLLYQAPGTGKFTVAYTGTDSNIALAVTNMTFSSASDAVIFMAAMGATTADYTVKPEPANNTLNAKFGLVRTTAKEGATDDCGRAATNYTASEVKDFGVLVYDVATPTFTYTYGAEAADIKADLKNYKYATKAADTNKYTGTISGLVIVDGTDVDVELGAEEATLPEIIASYAINNSIVEVYTDSKKVVTDVIVSNTYAVKLAKASSATTAANGDDIAKNAIYFTLDSKKYAAPGFAKDDIVVVTVANNNVQSIAKTTKITGEMTSISKDNVYTIAGGEYVLADTGVLGTVTLDDSLLNVEKIYYIGVNGTIVSTGDVAGDKVSATTDYAIILDAIVEIKINTAWGSAELESIKAQVKALTVDGEAAIYDIPVIKDADGNYKIATGGQTVPTYCTVATAADLKAALADAEPETKVAALASAATTELKKLAGYGKVYTYKMSDGAITLTATLAALSGTETSNKVRYLCNKNQVINKNVVAIDNSGKVAIVNSETKFILRDAEGNWLVKVGPAALENSMSSKSGSITAIVDVTSNGTASKNVNVAKVVFFNLEPNSPAEGYNVFVADESITATENKVYVDGNYSATKDAEGVTVYNYTGVKADGTSVALTGAKDLAAGIYVYNTDMTIKYTEEADKMGTAGEVVTKAGSTVKVGDAYLTVNADTVIINVETGAKDELTVGDKVCYIADGNVAELIFIYDAK